MAEAAAPQPTTAPEPARAGAEREALAGLVERVTFHSPETWFCVLRVKARGQRDLVTVVGHAAMISAGEFVQATGSSINDRNHGVQFKAAFLRAAHHAGGHRALPRLRDNQGHRPVYGQRLVQAFGEAASDVIKQEPGRLREVGGAPRSSGRLAAVVTVV